MVELYAIIKGKVQGVGYRAYVEGAANELKLSGYARNMPDRTVEVVAQGDQQVLKEFVEYLNEGSLLANVETVEVEWRSVKREYDDFSLRI